MRKSALGPVRRASKEAPTAEKVSAEAMQKDPFGNICFLFAKKTYSALKIVTWNINGFIKHRGKSALGCQLPSLSRKALLNREEV
jgi:hypothetical protein